MWRAARQGHTVLFVQSGSFLLRGWGSILRHPWAELRARLLGHAVDGIQVRNAFNAVPWGKRYGLAGRINFGLTGLLLRRAIARLPRPVVLWLYDPAGASMVGSLGEDLAVYDCVDDYPEQHAPDARRVAVARRADAEAGVRSRLVFATTKELAERHRTCNPRTYLVPNAADYEHFSQAAERSSIAREVRTLPRPIIGFAGNLTHAKVDFSALRQLAAERPDWTLLLIGPVQAEARREMEELIAMPNVTWVGWRSYEELPQYVAAFDVGLCPYLANTYTRNVFPLKVYEYLAAGKAVVASGTPSLAGMEPDVVLADGPGPFVAAVEDALERSAEGDRARRMALAAQNTWDGRTERLLTLIAAELEGETSREAAALGTPS
jgi:glycosyltransferase involved in cell wall biosynthesis